MLITTLVKKSHLYSIKQIICFKKYRKSVENLNKTPVLLIVNNHNNFPAIIL